METKAEMLELTVAAQRARLSPKQALRLVTLGELEGAKRDGRWMVSASSVEALAQSRALGASEHKALR
jgi:hypothetical protein